MNRKDEGFKEREEIMMEFSETSQSSQETLLTEEDREKISENENIYFERSSSCKIYAQIPVLTENITGVSRSASKNRRNNKIKNWKTRNSFEALRIECSRREPDRTNEENDSGFATSSEQHLKTATPEESYEEAKSHHEKEEMDFDPSRSDSEDSCISTASISLLQTADITERSEAHENGGCVNDRQNIKFFLPLDEHGMHIQQRENPITKSARLSPVECIGKSSDFLRSLITLKQILSSKRSISTKNYLGTLKEKGLTTFSKKLANESDVDLEARSRQFQALSELNFEKNKFENKKMEKRQRDIVSHEAMHYSARTTNAEDIMESSVESILVWLKKEIRKNCKNLCDYWHDSVRADAVEMINEAVDSDTGSIRVKVSDFLMEIFDEIYGTEYPVQDAILECKASFLSNFCKSILLSFDLIGHVSNKLFQLMRARTRDKLQMINSVKIGYFSLRLMSDLLRSFLDRLETEEFKGMFRRKSHDEELDILNLWKRKRRKSLDSESNQAEEKIVRYLNEMREWCMRIDKILKFCIKEVPLLSMLAHECSLLAQEILFKVQNAALMQRET